MPSPRSVFNTFHTDLESHSCDTQRTPGARADDNNVLAARIKRETGYHAFPKQREFHECGAKYRLFGGAAGPGKSKALLMEAIAQANETPGSNTLLLRRTFPELEGSLLLYFRRDVPRECYRSFNEAKHIVTWHNGSTTRFGYSQSENDIYQYQSSEFLFIGIDELTHFTLRQWQFLTSRNRCSVPGSKPCMAGATNPGNIGHAWVKSLFIDKQPAAGMEPREYDPSDYAFISARVTDNPIYATDSAYLKTLQQLPDFYRRAFLDGDWSVFAGQYFSNFDPSQSVIRAEQIAAEPWWPRWISVDWGFEHPAAVYWHTSAPNFHASALAERSFVGRGFNRDVNAGLSQGALAPEGHFSADAGSVAQASACTHLVEDQGHRHADSQTHESADGHSANNLANPPAGDAALREFRQYGEFHERGGRYNRDEFYEQAGRASRLQNANSCAFPVEGDAPASQRNYFVDDLPHETRRASRVPDAAAPTHSSFDCHSEESRWSSIGTTRNLQLPREEQCASGPFLKGGNASRATTITYREFIAQHLAPRVLAAQIIERSRLRTGVTEKIDAIYLSPDAFARRTDESSIAEQMGDILQTAGLPRPVPADNDRIGGWMLMYQMLDACEWLIADSCPELIRTLPELVRDEVNIEDIAKRDGDDACLAEGTLIQCRRGQVPIQHVELGEDVLTRHGWRKVVWSGMTADRARRICMRFTDGSSISGTASHPILLNGEWKRLDSARYGDTLLRCTKRRSSMAAVVTAAIRILGRAAIGFTSWPPASEATTFCIATSGATRTVRFPRDITSTTLTAIPSTTTSAIWNVFLRASTWPDIPRLSKDWFSKAPGVWQKLAQPLLFGINPKKVASLRDASLLGSCGCGENGRNVGCVQGSFGDFRGATFAPMRVSLPGAVRCIWMMLQRIVSVAERHFGRIATTAYDFVPVSVLGVTEETQGPVYNLAVDEQPEFFANGILVHNCDAARYGLKSRASGQPAKPPREQEFAQRVTSTDPTIRAIQARKAELELRNSAGPVVHRRNGKNQPLFGRFSPWRRR